MSATKHYHHDTIEANMRHKTRPILFSADMVRAILDGRKTQTRRKIIHTPLHTTAIWHDGGAWIVQNQAGKSWKGKLTCPYGHPGDHLYVRETWRWFDAMAESDQDGVYSGYQYRADVPSEHDDSIVWRPSIHMPRLASRILLEITDIRPQRLHDITEADAIAEGINSTTQNGGPNKYYDNYHTGRWMEPEFLNNPILSFRTLWEKINGPGWDANPWVWAITFQKIEK